MPGTSSEQLLKSLDSLRKRLIESGVERTHGLHEAIGDDCTFYLKSLNLFIRRDYEDLESLVSEVKKCFDVCKEEVCER